LVNLQDDGRFWERHDHKLVQLVLEASLKGRYGKGAPRHLGDCHLVDR
jgi:hypothetical protein